MGEVIAETSRFLALRGRGSHSLSPRKRQKSYRNPRTIPACCTWKLSLTKRWLVRSFGLKKGAQRTLLSSWGTAVRKLRDREI
jgi:hypothetical protein